MHNVHSTAPHNPHANTHSRNTVRYYLIALIFLAFLFFSNDFGLIDVQKTAIVMAVGVDREEDEFILTSQIAVPQASTQGKDSESVQLVSRGKTVAQAFEQINTKTGWYPKLVFCNLIVLGKKTAEANIFDALEVFLRQEYLTDDCQLAVCDGLAKDILNASALVDPSSSLAVRKVLSEHAERAGTVYPVNLKDFAVDYFGDSHSGLLPIVKTEAQQEQVGGSSGEGQTQGGNGGSGSNGGNGGQGSQNGQGGSSSGESSGGQSSESQGGSSGESSQGGDGSGGSGGSGGQSKQGGDQKPVFSARETALFVRGKWVERLNEDETFALNAAIGKLRLASYTIKVGEESCTLSIKRNQPKITLDLGKEGRGVLKIRVKMIAGLMDYSKAQGLKATKDMGEIPDGAFFAAAQKLESTIITTYEKAKAVGCDVFSLQERLVKYKKRKFLENQDRVLADIALSVKVEFGSVR